jgi:predicted Zn-dependent protease with MMP-like domain
MVEQACQKLPPRMRHLLRNVAVTVEDAPLHDEGFEGSLGLYRGIPVGERGSAYSMVMPDKITIYRQPLLTVCHSQQELRREVALTVIHEVGHYFGLGDHEIPF